MNFKKLLDKITIVKRCSTIEEAEAQVSKLSRIRWISLILSIPVPILLAFVIRVIPFLEPLLMSLTMITAGVGIFFFMFIHFMFLNKARLEKCRLINITCPKCQTKYDFSQDVEYTFDDVSTSSQVTNGGTIYTSVFTKYKFHCTCQKCGEEKIFYSEFVCRQGSASAYGGHSSGVDTEPQMKKYFS